MPDTSHHNQAEPERDSQRHARHRLAEFPNTCDYCRAAEDAATRAIQGYGLPEPRARLYAQAALAAVPMPDTSQPRLEQLDSDPFEIYGFGRNQGPVHAIELPGDAITAATENITAFLIGCGWTVARAAEVAPQLADNLVAAVMPDIAAQATAAERDRIQRLLRDVAARFRDVALHAGSAMDNEAAVRTARAIDELADLLDGDAQ
jgi:hypothetical protein